MKARFLFVLSAAIALGLSAHAQDAAPTTQPPAAADTPAAVDATDAPAVEKDSHTLAAETLLETMNMKEVTKRNVDDMLAMQIQQQPQLGMFKDVMQGFLRKHLSYESLKDDMVKMYKEEFTENELGQLSDFYQTPVGKKAIERLPTLTAKGAQLGMLRVQQNMGELQELIMKRTMELQGGAGPQSLPTIAPQ
ncbi:hypothetical protein CA13_41580 [Planctomycetes bacterium CA13]|uniref:DUF2059 domain-containing protein n=1 Tax=Novipirellula herctigrandis TaxID=2527986 RepID=A0A5C5Z658_9BACT|nr:hypothetical protein CA13_41580 [Planctomycetes bacterium CA13]